MKSSEIREQTGLTEKAMRLYEDKGLITPQIREQGGRRFREYSEDDLAVLMTVAALRRARFSIEQIGRMLDDPRETEAVFIEYRAGLAREMAELTELTERVNAVDPASLGSAGALAEALTPVAQPMELPVRDMEYRPYRWEDISDEERRAAFERFWKKQERRLDRERLLLELCGLIGRTALCIVLPSLIIAALLYYTPVTRKVDIAWPAVEYDTASGAVLSETTLIMQGKEYYYLFQPDVFEGTVEIHGCSLYSEVWEWRWGLAGAKLEDGTPYTVRLKLKNIEVPNWLEAIGKNDFRYQFYREPIAKGGLDLTEYLGAVCYMDPDDPLAALVFVIMEPTGGGGHRSGDRFLIAPAATADEAHAIWRRLQARWQK